MALDFEPVGDNEDVGAGCKIVLTCESRGTFSLFKGDGISR